MPVARFQMPDGRVARFEVPDGTSPEQAQQMIMQAMAPKVDQAAIDADMKRMADPTTGMSGFEKFASGAGKAVTDIGRGVGQMFGQVSRQDVAESRKRDQPLMNTGAGVAGNIFGNVAAAVPTAFIPGANTIVGGTAIGAGLGLIQPSESTGETLKNTAIGGVAGGAVPLISRGYQVGKSFVEPFYESGRNQIMGRALRKAAGDQADDAMRNMQSARELVPGSMPTAGEAAQNPGIAAMQRTATAIDPVSMNQMAARQAAQNEARLAALQGVTPDVAAAKAARGATAENLYGQARAAGFDPAKVQAIQPKLDALISRVPDELVGEAKQLAKISGEQFTDAGSVQGAHWIKKAIDSKISQAKRGGNDDLARVYTGLQKEFLDVLDDLAPAYQTARQKFAEMSQPVTQGRIMEEVTKRGQNFRGDLTPAAYARALNDKVAQGVTRMPLATLEGSLSPQQMEVLKNVKQDLLRSDFAQTAGKGVGSDTVQKLAFSNMMDQSGLPQLVKGFGPAGVIGNIGQRVGQVAYKDANERMAADLAQALMNPQAAARLMQAGRIDPQTMALVEALKRGGTALGSSVPGMIQANQQ